MLVALVLLFGAACTVRENMGLPYCTGSSSPTLISGQSVQTATLLTCFEPLPRGWETGIVDIGHEGTTVVFDSDRAGDAAATFRFEKSCDIGDATPTPTNFERTSRYERIFEVEPGFVARRYYLFDGGCVTWEFDFASDAPSAMAVELGNSLQFVDREWVNQNMRDTFVDEDL